MSDEKTFVDIRDLTVTFTGGRKPVRAVSGVNLKVKRGEVVALIGESGSGKASRCALFCACTTQHAQN